MKFILLVVCICVFQCLCVAQTKVTSDKKFEKEIGVSFFVIYPDEYLPSISFSISKIISPTFQVGVGINEIYFRYRRSLYVPVYTDFQITAGKKKKLGFNIKAGYGFFNSAETGKYAWGPGNVIVKRKGGIYSCAGVTYAFDISSKAFKAGINYTAALNKQNIFIEATKQSSNYVEKNRQAGEED